MAIDYDKAMRPNLYEIMQGGGSGYTLPIASEDELGGVKIGENAGVSIDETSGIIDLNINTIIETFDDKGAFFTWKNGWTPLSSTELGKVVINQIGRLHIVSGGIKCVDKTKFNPLIATIPEGHRPIGNACTTNISHDKLTKGDKTDRLIYNIVITPDGQVLFRNSNFGGDGNVIITQLDYLDDKIFGFNAYWVAAE